MTDEDAMKQVEQVAQSMAQNLHQKEVTQAKMVYWSIRKDKKNLSQEQFEDVETLLALVHGIDGGSIRFTCNGGFRRTFILDVEAYSRQMREEAVPALAGIDDERVKELCALAETICREAGRVVAAVDPKFVTDRSGKKKKAEE